MPNFISTGSTYWISDEEIQISKKTPTNGDKNSAFKLYQYHMFVSLDQDLEFKWLEIAAENGHSIAQSNLADLFFTQGNKEKAIFWAERAHRNGAKLPEVASQSNQKWNHMTNIAQFKVKPGTTIIEGKAVPQGLGLPGGQTQKYMNDLKGLIRQ